MPGKGLTLRQYENALRSAAGVQSVAAEKLGVTRSAVAQRIARAPRLQKVMQDIDEQILDVAEAAVITKMRGGDGQLALRYLAMKGKSRGYGVIKADIETQGGDGKTTKTRVTISGVDADL